MDAKKDILWRVYLVYILMCIFGIAIIVQAVNVQMVEGDEWKEKAEVLTTKYMNIEAVRGNIFASDGSLLATSIPTYEIRMDVNVDPLTDEHFYAKIDSLALGLSRIFGDRSKQQYKSELIEARREGSRYHLIQRDVSYKELKKLRQLPIFRLGQYKGGLIYIQKNKRVKPFKALASRTIGYERPGIQPVGLEGAYSEYLKGVGGKRLMQKISGGVWKPINDDNEIEPKDGMDVITTIDINIQDVAEHALLKQLEKHNAHHGCAVLMEVETGEIKAIANLSRHEESGKYGEYYNYAIGEATEPGSTFKLASVIALLEDGLVDTNDIVDTKDGTRQFYDRVMKDSDYKKGGHGEITLKRAFEISSNVGIATMVNDHYQKDPQKFVDRLHAMRLNEPLGLEIPGEGKPAIKTTKDSLWSGVSLPWMSIGYELLLTPMQILTFYNAVANDGKMVKPKLVKEVNVRGKAVETFETEVLNEQICSRKTISKVRDLLEGVVEQGTAQNLSHADYKIAGKTGTAQIAKHGSYKTDRVTYQASFVGYFPADNPKYTCIVVVNAPSNWVYYGNLVAGPIFKEISDKVYSSSLDMHEELKADSSILVDNLPYSKHGHQNDLKKVFAELNIPANTENESSRWVAAETTGKLVKLEEKQAHQRVIPDVVGMGVEDAIYILENLGLKVKIKGRGVIVQQSIIPGTRVTKGREIVLRLS